MINDLVTKCPDHYVYYFDIPFEETLSRHATKPIALEVGEYPLRSWYMPQDVTGFENETIIPKEYSLDQTVRRIVADAGL
jgi:hypothetical protein